MCVSRVFRCVTVLAEQSDTNPASILALRHAGLLWFTSRRVFQRVL